MEVRKPAYCNKLNEKTIDSQVVLSAKRPLVEAKWPFRVSLLKPTEVMWKYEEFRGHFKKFVKSTENRENHSSENCFL